MVVLKTVWLLSNMLLTVKKEMCVRYPEIYPENSPFTIK